MAHVLTPLPLPEYPVISSRARVFRHEQASSWVNMYETAVKPDFCTRHKRISRLFFFCIYLSLCVLVCLFLFTRPWFGHFPRHRYDPHGFQLGDGVDVRGSMICMPNSFVLWQPKIPSDITVESLRILELVIPKIGTASNAELIHSSNALFAQVWSLQRPFA